MDVITFLILPTALVILWIIPASVAMARKRFTGSEDFAMKKNITLPLLRPLVQGVMQDDLGDFVGLTILLPLCLCTAIGAFLAVLALRFSATPIVLVSMIVLFFIVFIWKKFIAKVIRKIAIWLTLSKEERAQIALGTYPKGKKKDG